jgi:hypothetical protein
MNSIGLLGPGRFSTISGVHVDALDPDHSAAPTLRDAALSLGNQCRWGGHMELPYSVARHSLYVASVAERLVSLARGDGRAAFAAGLTHDLGEVILQDLTTPAKAVFDSSAIREKLEIRWTARLRREFGFEQPNAQLEHAIKNIDSAALLCEDFDLRGGRVLAARGLLRPSVANYPLIDPAGDCGAREWFFAARKCTGSLSSWDVHARKENENVQSG